MKNIFAFPFATNKQTGPHDLLRIRGHFLSAGRTPPRLPHRCDGSSQTAESSTRWRKVHFRKKARHGRGSGSSHLEVLYSGGLLCSVAKSWARAAVATTVLQDVIKGLEVCSGTRAHTRWSEERRQWKGMRVEKKKERKEWSWKGKERRVSGGYLRARRTAAAHCCSPAWWWTTASPRGCTLCLWIRSTWTRSSPLLEGKRERGQGLPSHSYQQTPDRFSPF